MASKKFYHDIDLVNVGQLVGARIQNVTTAERTTLGGSLNTTSKGLQVWDTDLNAPFIWEGTQWVRDALEVTGDIVFRGVLNDLSVDPSEISSGSQYVAGVAGTLEFPSFTTYVPAASVEAGDTIYIGTDSAGDPAVYVLQKNDDARIANIESKNTAQDGRLDVNEADIDALETRATAIESKNTDQDGRLTTNESDIDALETRATAIEAKDVEQDGRLDVNEADIDSLETEQASQGTRITTLEGEMDAAEGRLTTNEADIDALETEQASQGTRITTLEGEMDAAEGRLTVNEGEIDTLQSEVSSLQTFTGEGTALDTAATDLAAAVNELHTEVTASTAKNSEQDGRLDAVETKNTAQDGRLDTLEGEMDAAEGRLDAVEAEADALNTFTGLGTALDTDATDLAAAVNELHSDAATEKAAVAAKNSEQDGRLGTLESEMDAAEGRLDDVEAKDVEQDGRLDALEALDTVKTFIDNDVTVAAGTATTISHNLSLSDKDAFTIRIADSNGSDISLDVDSVDFNSITITSLVELTGVKVTIIGF